MGDNANEGAGTVIVGWLALCFVTGESITGLIFLVVGLFWILPTIWDKYISKTFAGDTSRLLLFLAALCIILAIYYML
jgi:hypothetical protein